MKFYNPEDFAVALRARATELRLLAGRLDQNHIVAETLDELASFFEPSKDDDAPNAPSDAPEAAEKPAPDPDKPVIA